MARNRKRAKERRTRRPEAVTARTDREDAANPIRHAAPDVELAEAQLALGRPELAADELEPEEEAEFEEELENEADAEAEEAEAGGARGGRGAGFDGGGRRGGGSVSGSGGELAVPAGAVPATQAGILTRLVTFLQGSWRELQRVQWPDRRQVMQATGVVIGFVIVAGVFLGVADFLATKLMNYVLK